MLISRCESEFGTSLKNLNSMPTTKRSINISLLMTPEISQTAPNKPALSQRRGFSDYLPRLASTPRLDHSSIQQSKSQPFLQPVKPHLLSTTPILEAFSARSKPASRQTSPTARIRQESSPTASLSPEQVFRHASKMIEREQTSLAHSFKPRTTDHDTLLLPPVRVAETKQKGMPKVRALLGSEDAIRFSLSERVLIPFFISAPGGLHYTLIVLDRSKHVLSFFDPLPHNAGDVKSGARFEIIYVNSLLEAYPRSALQLQELSLGAVSQPTVMTENFAVIDEPSPLSREIGDSGYWMLYFLMLVVARTKRNPVFSSTVLQEFKLKLQQPTLA